MLGSLGGAAALGLGAVVLRDPCVADSGRLLEAGEAQAHRSPWALAVGPGCVPKL